MCLGLLDFFSGALDRVCEFASFIRRQVDALRLRSGRDEAQYDGVVSDVDVDSVLSAIRPIVAS
jgi:hypothetical protein